MTRASTHAPAAAPDAPDARRIKRSPLVPVAAALICGIILGRWTQAPPHCWPVVACAAMAAALAAMTRPHLHALAVAASLAAVAAVGATLAYRAFYTLDENHIAHYARGGRSLVHVIGRIVTSPQIAQAPSRAVLGYAPEANTTFLLDATHIYTGAGRRDTTGLIRVTVRQPAPDLQLGQHVEMDASMARLSPPRNPGQYDRLAAGLLQGVLVQADVPLAQGVTPLAADDGPAHRLYWRLRAAVRQRLADCGDADEARLVSALIVGERHPSLSKLNATMMRAGVVHYMSISGSHLCVFMGFVYLLGRVLMLSPRRAAAAAMAALGAYLLLAEPNGPLFRSAVMAACLCAAVIVDRPYSSLNALALAAIVILVADPLDLFSPGFALSFGVVLGLITLYPIVRRILFGRWLRRRGLVVFRDDQRVRRWLYFRLGDGAAAVISASLTAYLVSAPLAAWHFGIFSPWAIVLSPLLAVPVAIVLTPGYLSVALHWAMPNAAYWLGELAAWGADLIEQFVSLVERLPLLSVELREVDVLWVLGCYALVLAAVLYRRLPGKLAWAAAIAVLLGGWTLYTQRTAPEPAGLELDFLDVGAGQCVVMRTPDGATRLLDAGSRSGFDAARQTLLPFLRHQRLPWPSEAYISHANTDHFNAITGLLERRNLGSVIAGVDFAPPANEPAGPARALLDALDRRHVPVRRVSAPLRVMLDEQTSLEVLWPPGEAQGQFVPNERSLVLRIARRGQSVLLPGDIEEKAQAALVASADLRADVLVLPHHGSWRKTLPALVEAVSPKVVVVSAAQEPLGPVKPAEAREFYANLRSRYQYYSTARNGWCRVALSGGKIEVITSR
jgi:competence protein ComEC